jgi:hypothetical protein
MADDLLKMKYDKLLSELKFLEDDLKYHKTLLDREMDRFSKSFDDKARELGAIDKLRPPVKKPKQAAPKKKPPTRKETRDLFKKIATVTHPDKLLDLPLSEKERKEEKFLEATEAANEDKILSLHKIAKEVGVELPEISEIQIALFEDEISTHKQDIENIKRTWIWAWMNAPDEKIRDVIMSRYVNFLLTSTPT